jgi:hypothetical protein
VIDEPVAAGLFGSEDAPNAHIVDHGLDRALAGVGEVLLERAELVAGLPRVSLEFCRRAASQVDAWLAQDVCALAPAIR